MLITKTILEAIRDGLDHETDWDYEYDPIDQPDHIIINEDNQVFKISVEQIAGPTGERS